MILRTGLKALGAVTQLVFESPAKTPSLGLANANPNQSNFEECVGISEIETEVESIHAFETITSILTADGTTTATLCTGTSKANLKTEDNNINLELELTSERNNESQVFQQYLTV